MSEVPHPSPFCHRPNSPQRTSPLPTPPLLFLSQRSWKCARYWRWQILRVAVGSIFRWQCWDWFGNVLCAHSLSLLGHTEPLFSEDEAKHAPLGPRALPALQSLTWAESRGQGIPFFLLSRPLCRRLFPESPGKRGIKQSLSPTGDRAVVAVRGILLRSGVPLCSHGQKWSHSLLEFIEILNRKNHDQSLQGVLSV